MSSQEKMLILFGGLFIILILATFIGRILSSFPNLSKPRNFVENLNARINSWWAMIALIGLAFLFGNNGVICLFAILSFAAFREFITLSHTQKGDHWSLLVAFFFILPLQYILIGIDWYGFYSIFIPVYAFLLMPIVSALRGQTKHFLERISEVQWGLMISIFCLSHVPALLNLKIPSYEGQNLLLIAFLIVVVQMSDVLQYVWGNLIGRHKIAPFLSPSKTIEGFIGGILSATIIGTSLWWITPFNPWQAALLALTATVLGFCGGLVMSAIKRDRGVKDWGWIIEGHGGVLDRLDSLVFAAPIFFHLVRFWWAV